MTTNSKNEKKGRKEEGKGGREEGFKWGRDTQKNLSGGNPKRMLSYVGFHLMQTITFDLVINLDLVLGRN